MSLGSTTKYLFAMVKSVLKFPFAYFKGIIEFPFRYFSSENSRTYENRLQLEGKDFPQSIAPRHGKNPLTRVQLDPEDQVSGNSLDDPENYLNIDVNVVATSSFIGKVRIENDGLVFPNVHSGPGSYCITFQEQLGDLSVYIGETEQLRRQFQFIRTPGNKQKTNFALNLFINEIINRGGEVRIHVIASAFVNGKSLDLDRRAARSIIKQAWILSAHSRGVKAAKIHGTSRGKQKNHRAKPNDQNSPRSSQSSAIPRQKKPKKPVSSKKKIHPSSTRQTLGPQRNKKTPRKKIVKPNGPDRSRGNIPMTGELCGSCGTMIYINGKCGCS